MSEETHPTTGIPAGIPLSQPPVSITTAKPKYEFFKVIQGYLNEASHLVDVSPYVSTILSQPKNEIIVNFPVRMDDGSYRLFKGYRIQHNNLLGPYKGGIRYHESVSLDDLKALAACIRGSRQVLSRDEVGRIAVPTLVSVGTKDPIAGSPHDLAALMPNARALDIPGRDHNLAVGDKIHKQGVLEFLAERP